KNEGPGVRVGVDSAARFEECGLLGNSSATGTVFEAGVHTGQLSAASVDHPLLGLVAKCQENTTAIYHARIAISNTDVCGEYRIEAHMVRNESESVLTSYFDVICFWFLEIDFSSVNWGDEIVPGEAQVLNGDVIWNAPNDTAPSLMNTGNHGMGVGFVFGPMAQLDDIGNTVPGGGIIDVFGACFGNDPLSIQCIDPVQASQEAHFDDAAERVLCVNQVGSLDLSIHPSETIPAGPYAGQVTILARSVHGVCPTDQETHENPT
ncbi:MAG: hypothetical protein ACE1Y4_04945, partial [Lysobacterales bacterium]